jgi:hypothetical protein
MTPIAPSSSDHHHSQYDNKALRYLTHLKEEVRKPSANSVEPEHCTGNGGRTATLLRVSVWRYIDMRQVGWMGVDAEEWCTSS